MFKNAGYILTCRLNYNISSGISYSQTNYYKQIVYAYQIGVPALLPVPGLDLLLSAPVQKHW